MVNHPAFTAFVVLSFLSLIILAIIEGDGWEAVAWGVAFGNYLTTMGYRFLLMAERRGD